MNPGRPTMEVNIENKLDTFNGMMISAMIAPVAGAVAAGAVAYRTLKGKVKDDE
jgi:formate dehydrogenase iron-sulfur subunit